MVLAHGRLTLVAGAIALLTGACAGDRSVPEAQGPDAATVSPDAATPPPAAPASVVLVSGSGQSAQAGTALAADVVVRVLDRAGSPVAGGQVTFRVTLGGGSVAVDSQPSDASGTARARWTLGTVAGPQSLVATLLDVSGDALTSVTVDASAVPGPPATVAISGGGDQVAEQLALLPVPISARVTDAYGNGAPDVIIAFVPREGHGTVAQATALTDGAGVATAAWTLGAPIGRQTLDVRVDGLAPASMSATATAGPLRATVIVVSGDGQVGAINSELSRPVVVRFDGLDGPIAGRSVSFEVSAGGGSLGESSVETGPDGTAAVGWTLGLTRTEQRLRISAIDPVSGRAVPPLTVTADPTGPLVVNSLEDVEMPAPGSVTLRLAVATAAPDERIAFDRSLDSGTILLGVVGAEHTVLKGEVYKNNAFSGYEDRDYGKSALYARKNLVIDASMLPGGIELRWTGGEASHARVLAVYGNLTLRNVTVSSGVSVAEPVEGGQVFTLARGAGLAVWGTAKLDHCTIAGNTCLGEAEASRDRGAYGGGIYANGLELHDCVVSGNSAIGYGAGGGGIYSVGGADRTDERGNDTLLDRCTVSGNRVRAQHAYGGGVFTLSGGPNNLATMRIVNSTVARNLAEDNPDLPQQGEWYDRGGGIYMGGGSLSIVSSTIAENAVTGIAAIFREKPNLGGGGIAATIGNAHTVENVTLQDSIVAGNTLNGASEDWFAGSILDFRSRGYNLVGRVDFSQILVPVPAWSMLSRKRWPKAGDADGVALADALDLAGARLHRSVLSAGTDAGKPALLWYPPGPRAVDRVPRGARLLTYVVAGYDGAGVATDDFLNHVIAQLRHEYGAVLGAQFGEELGDLTGTTWVLDAVTWPSNPQNKNWIAFWRNLDLAIGDKLGMAGLGDEFWGTFQSGPLCPWVTMTVAEATESALPEAADQTGRARPGGQSGMGDIGAIEK